jgi:hypothetical protein
MGPSPVILLALEGEKEILPLQSEDIHKPIMSHSSSLTTFCLGEGLTVEFLMALFIFPLLSFLFGIIGQILIKKVFVVVGITFAVWFIAAFTVFNDSFFVWVLVYTALSALGASIVYFGKNSKKRS